MDPKKPMKHKKWIGVEGKHNKQQLENFEFSKKFRKFKIFELLFFVFSLNSDPFFVRHGFLWFH